MVHYSDDYTKEEGSEGYDQDDKAVEAAEKLIDAIGSPVTLQSREKIEKARAAYDALSYAQKQKVSNYDKLQQAEEALERLQQAEDKRAAEAVAARIAALPDPVAEKDEPAVAAARAAYDALTDRQKLLVTNYGRLTESERQLALLKATEEDKKAAAAVEALIDAIPSPLTPEDEDAVKAAREAYDKLTDLQKKLVKNADKLQKAEETLKQLKRTADLREIYKTTGDYIAGLGDLDAGSDWMALGMIRSGREINK